MYIVELEPGVWLAPWDGDPGRTLQKTNARRIRSRGGASAAIRKAREYRPFKNARVLPAPSGAQPAEPITVMVECVRCTWTGTEADTVRPPMGTQALCPKCHARTRPRSLTPLEPDRC